MLSALDEYENRITALKTDNLERMNTFFRGVEDSETFYQSSVHELVVNALEQSAVWNLVMFSRDVMYLFKALSGNWKTSEPSYPQAQHLEMCDLNY